MRKYGIDLRMKKLFNMFKSYSDLYLTPEYSFNPTNQPKQLIEQLTHHPRSSCMAEFLKKTQKLSQKSDIYRLRILTILGLLFLYSDSFYQVVLLIVPLKTPLPKSDQLTSQNPTQWLDANIIRPCEQFLMKCSSSSELYRGIKNFSRGKSKSPLKYYNFQTLYYLINLIKKATILLDKISCLGRYYQQQYPVLSQLYVFVFTIHIIRLYSPLKMIILEMLMSPAEYLQISSDRELMKSVLVESLPEINQSMKNIILNKYFSPYDHGIRVVLLTNQNQNPQISRVIYDIIKDESIISTDRKFYNQTVREMRDDYSLCKQSLFTDLKSNNCRSLTQFRRPDSLQKTNESYVATSNFKPNYTSHQQKQRSVLEPNRQSPSPVSANCMTGKQIKHLKDLKLKKMATLQELDEQVETEENEPQLNNGFHIIMKKKSFKGNIKKEWNVQSQEIEIGQKLFNTEKQVDSMPGKVLS